jgi:hypothetical protein
MKQIGNLLMVDSDDANILTTSHTMLMMSVLEIMKSDEKICVSGLKFFTSFTTLFIKRTNF